MAPPLRILGMVANPSDQPTLDVTVEKQRVEEAVKDLQTAGQVELAWLEGETWRHQQRAMWPPARWHVFHFIRHGTFDLHRDEGMIALANEAGRAHLLSAVGVTAAVACSAAQLWAKLRGI